MSEYNTTFVHCHGHHMITFSREHRDGEQVAGWIRQIAESLFEYTLPTSFDWSYIFACYQVPLWRLDSSSQLGFATWYFLWNYSNCARLDE